MMATRPANETERTAALGECADLETSILAAFEGIVRDAAHVCEAPIALLNLVESSEVRCIASVGWHPAALNRDDALCSHVILAGEPLLVPDAACDDRFANSPLVSGEPGIRMYAGVPLVTGDGLALGTICVINREARTLTPGQVRALCSLASHATALLEVRRAHAQLARATEERLCAEAARDESEQRFRLLADHSMDIIGRYRPDGICTYVSPAVERILGYQPDEFIGLAVAMLVHEDDQPRARAAMTAAIEAGQSQIVEYRSLSKAGEWVWFETTFTPVFDHDTNEVQELQLHGRDITTRHLADEALRESEARFRLLAENASDLISRHTPDGTFLYVSPSSMTMLGYTPEELIGTPSLRLVHRDDRQAVIDGLTTRPRGAPIALASCRMRRKDGTYVWVESTDGALYDDVTGELVEYQSVTRNITKRVEAQEALGESEDRFRKIFEESPVAMGLIGQDMRFKRMNAAFQALLGYTEEELRNLQIADVSEPDEMAAHVDNIERMFAGEIDSYQMEKRYKTKDGATIWAHLTGAAMHDRDGRVRSGLGIVEDITQRKRIHEELQASEERFRRIFEDSPIAIAVIGDELRFERMNSAFCDLLGYTREELMSMTSLQISHPDGAIPSAANLRELFAGEIDTYRLEKRYITKSGETIWANLTATAIYDPETGRRLGMGMFEDITERKRVREELQASEQRFRRVFEEGPVGMCITTPDLRFVRVNSAFCRMLGYTEAELVERSVYDVSAPDDMTETERQLAHMTAGAAGPFQFEKRYITKAGATIWAHVTASPLRSGSGEAVYGLGIVEDITERKLAEIALRNLAALKSDFVALVSHELRAPLTNMNGAIELMSSRADQLPDDESRRTLQILSEQTMRLTHLVASILDVSRLDAGQVPITLGAVAMDIVAAEAVAAVSTRAPAPELRLACGPDMPLAWADEIYVRQIVENLIENAIKHSGTSAPILIESEAAGRSVTLSVTDRGRGIALDEQLYIFDAFFRSPHNDAQSDGQGLGLYFARKLLEAQGGGITLTSPVFDDVDRSGTRFTITLPLAPEEP